MAKHGKKGRRSFRRYLKGQISMSNALGTLGGRVVVSAVPGDVLTEKAWLSSVRLRYSLNNWTQIANAGPIMVGVAHSDYTSTEIEEWIENAASWEQADQIGQEIGRRRIRKVGVFQEPATLTDSVHLNDGKPIVTKCGWQLITGQTLRVWFYNMGSAPLATTDPNGLTEGHCNLWPN